MNTGEALKWAEDELKRAGIEGPRGEAEFLLGFILGHKRHELFMNAGKPLTDGQCSRLREFIGRRGAREPAQYITGRTDFRGLEFRVTRATLIPRPETELLIDEALKVIRGESPLVIDICTGSGCIAVAVAKESKACRVYATDISPEALEVAEENAARHGVSGRIRFLKGDLFTPLEGLGLEGRADLILSNPPYIPGVEFDGLQPEVRDFEPATALIGGDDGLDFIRRIIEGSPEYLSGNGHLIMEIGYGQAGSARRIAAKSSSYGAIAVKKDLSGIERILIAGRKGNAPSAGRIR